jgi:hypothetical protein
VGVEALRRLRRTLGADRRRHDPRQGGDPRAAIEAKLGSLTMFEVIEAANEDEGEHETTLGTTLATIWVSMKWHEARALVDDKTFHLLFDIDSTSVAV